MPQVPVPPSRTDSLPNSSSPTPPIPALPSQAARRGLNPLRKSRPRSGHASSYSPSSRRSAAPPKMSSSQDGAVAMHQGSDSSGMQVFEAKTHWKDSFKILYQMYENKELCDVEIVAGSKAFKCHRIVLACSSLYFRAMFMSEMAESRQDLITIQDIDEDAMQMLVEFAYTSKIKITTENVQPLLFAASILQVENVAEACASFMKSHLHPSNCIEVQLLYVCGHYMLIIPPPIQLHRGTVTVCMWSLHVNFTPPPTQLHRGTVTASVHVCGHYKVITCDLP